MSRARAGKQKVARVETPSLVLNNIRHRPGLSSHCASAPELSMIGPLFTMTKSFTVMAESLAGWQRWHRLPSDCRHPRSRCRKCAICDQDAVGLQTLQDRRLDRRHAGCGRMRAQIEPLVHVRHRAHLLPAACELGETNAPQPACHASGSSSSAERVGYCRMRPPYSAGAAENR